LAGIFVRPFYLPGGEGVVAGDLGEVAGVIEGEDADVARAADLKAIYAAVGGNYPGRLFCVPMNGSEQMECHEAQRTGVREYRDALTAMLSEDVAKLGRYAVQQMAVTFAISDDVMDVAVDKRVVVVGVRRF